MKYSYRPHKLPHTKEEWLLTTAINAGIYQGFSAVASWVINQNLKMHYRETRTPMAHRQYQSYRGPGQMDRVGKSIGMVALSPATPVVAATAGAGLASIATSIAYERTVNEQIREGQPNIWFGPYASGFGSVV